MLLVIFYLQPLPLIFPTIPSFICWLVIFSISLLLNEISCWPTGKNVFTLVSLWAGILTDNHFSSSISPVFLLSLSPFLHLYLHPVVHPPLSLLCVSLLSSSLSIPLSSVQLHSNPGRQQDLGLTGEMRWWNEMTSVVRMCLVQVCVFVPWTSSGSH